MCKTTKLHVLCLKHPKNVFSYQFSDCSQTCKKGKICRPNHSNLPLMKSWQWWQQLQKLGREKSAKGVRDWKKESMSVKAQVERLWMIGTWTWISSNQFKLDGSSLFCMLKKHDQEKCIAWECWAITNDHNEKPHCAHSQLYVIIFWLASLCCSNIVLLDVKGHYSRVSRKEVT